MRKLLLAAASSVALMLAGQTACAGPFTGLTWYFTTFTGGGTNVWTSTASYSGNGTAGNGTFTPGTASSLATTPGADGIVFNPNNNMLLIGGQNSGKVYQVNPVGGAFTSLDAGKSIFELTVDPSKNMVWGGSSENGAHTLTSVPLNPPGGAPTIVTVHGSNSSVTHLAFGPGLTPGTAYYTSSGNAGGGNFGLIDLVTGTTTALLTGKTFAHGIVFDPFTGDLMLAGGDEVAQIDPVTHAILSTRTFAGDQFDQGAVDGKGHLIWADNGGRLLFIDYSTTMMIGSAANFTSNSFYMANLDDVAPLVGTGSHNPGIPEPLTLGLVGGALAAMGGLRLRRKARRT